MKRTVGILLAVVLFLSLVGCAPKIPPIEMVDATFDGLTLQVPKEWKTTADKEGDRTYETEDGACIFLRSFAGYTGSNNQEELNSLIDHLLEGDSDELLERTELEVDGNPAVRLVLKDDDTKKLHLYLAAKYTTYSVNLYVPEANFDRHTAAYDAVIQSIKADPEFRKVERDGTLGITLDELLARLDSAYTSQGRTPLSEKRSSKQEDVSDGIAVEKYNILLSGTDVMMRLEVEKESQKVRMIFLSCANTLRSNDAIFYGGFTTGYLYGLFSDDTLDAEAIGKKLEISDDLNMVRTERAEYSRIVEDGDTLLMVEGLNE